MDPLWAQLINSDWHDHTGGGRRADRLADDRWLASFLALAGWRGRALPDARGRRRLRALRALLQRTVRGLLAGRAPGARAIAALNRLLAAFPTVARLERGAGGLTLATAPAASGVDRVLGAVAASFAELLTDGDPRRIRVCANPDCRWVFVDGSRSRTRRWCEAGVCGSLVKVRRFRARHRHPPAHRRAGESERLGIARAGQR